MKCDCCGKTFESGNRESGIPNGLGFVLQDGRQVTVCAECIMDMSKLKPFLDKVDTDCQWR